jgi:PAS domain S-box-containing protein
MNPREDDRSVRLMHGGRTSSPLGVVTTSPGRPRDQRVAVHIDSSLMRRVFDLMPVAVVVCDEHGTILCANPALERTFGYRPAEVIGEGLDMLLPLQDEEARGIRDTVLSGNAASRSALCVSELAARRKDGSDVRVEVRRLSVQSRQPFVVLSMVDVSERAVRALAIGGSDSVAGAKRVRDRLTLENIELRREVRRLGPRREVVAESQAIRRVLEQLETVAATDATVLLFGETGTGKEVFAQTIHALSERRTRPSVTVNCAAIPPALIESELFGRERGAYTGALARQAGRFELAHQSTIFLDEIGELPLEAQGKLLRVLQERVVERLGGGHPIKVDVRIIAATNRHLESAVRERAFREDLFYRLNVFPIVIPPLRERMDDLPALVWTFVDEYAQAFHKPIDSIDKDSMAALRRYHWPGNVRELRNVIERAVIVARGPRLTVDVPAFQATARASTRLADFEAEQIRKVMDSVGWRVRGAGGAAELLGIKPNTLDSRMAKLGIVRPRRESFRGR